MLLRLGLLDRFRRPPAVIVGAGLRAGSDSPVSSSDFIDCSTQSQPSATLASAIGLRPRSRWIVVTFVTPSPFSVSSHSMRLGGSSAAAAS